MKSISLFTHGLAAAAGFAMGIYLLPILIAPEAPTEDVVQAVSADAAYRTEFKRDLPGSDLLHWGEGEVSVSQSAIVLKGKLAPGPDYRLYLAPSFVEDEAGFLAIKDTSLEIGAVRTFDNFVVPFTQTVNLEAFNTVVIWCETFGQFITAAKYRQGPEGV